MGLFVTQPPLCLQVTWVRTCHLPNLPWEDEVEKRMKEVQESREHTDPMKPPPPKQMGGRVMRLWLSLEGMG